MSYAIAKPTESGSSVLHVLYDAITTGAGIINALKRDTLFKAEKSVPWDIGQPGLSSGAEKARYFLGSSWFLQNNDSRKNPCLILVFFPILFSNHEGMPNPLKLSWRPSWEAASGVGS